MRAVTAERAIFGDLRRARDFARMIRTSCDSPNLPSADSPSTFFVDGRSIPHSEDPRDPVTQPEIKALARARARARAKLEIREVTKVTRCLFDLDLEGGNVKNFDVARARLSPGAPSAHSRCWSHAGRCAVIVVVLHLCGAERRGRKRESRDGECVSRVARWGSTD